MFSDIRRIIVWLAACAALLFLLPALNVFSDRPFFWIFGIVAVLAVPVAFHFLHESILAAGASATVAQKGGTTTHTLSWGTILFFGTVSIGFAALIPYALRGGEPFWFWSLSVPGIAVCIYFFFEVSLSRARCNDRQLYIRSWIFHWTCHDWDDLISINSDDSQLHLRFSKTEYAELTRYMTGIERIHSIARAALDRNNRVKGTDDA